jgi:type II secretion system protein C
MNKSSLSNLIKKFKEKFSKEKSSGDGAVVQDNLVLKVFSPESRPFWHKIFLVLIVTVLFYTLGKLIAIKFSMLFAPPKLPLDFPEDTKVETNLMADLSTIKRANLFHSKDEDQKDQGKKKKSEIEIICQEAKAKSSLPFKLQDTIVLQDRKKSTAFLSINGQPADVFREGDVIKQVARLDKISRLSVIFRNLENAGCEYIANFDDQFEQMFSQKNLSILSPEAGKQILPDELKKNIRNVGNKYYLKTKLRDEMLADIGNVLTQARAVQINNPDGTLAFKMTEIVPGSIYSFLDLNDGDIITKINGKNIENVNEIMALFGGLKDFNNLSLTIQRDGEEQEKEYNFEK